MILSSKFYHMVEILSIIYHNSITHRKTCNIKFLADGSGVKQKTVEKYMIVLLNNNLVLSHRGNKGGYTIREDTLKSLTVKEFCFMLGMDNDSFTQASKAVFDLCENCFTQKKLISICKKYIIALYS